MATNLPQTIRTTLRQSVVARLYKEQALLSTYDNGRWSITQQNDDNDLLSWTATIHGPQDTPYEHGNFNVIVIFGDYYPLKPPEVKMSTPIYHCNINSSGAICLDILRPDTWTPNDTVVDVLNGIEILLRYPNPDDFIQERASRQLKHTPLEYIAEAKRWTQMHACHQSSEESV